MIKAFPSEVDTGSRQENALKQKTRALIGFNWIGKGSRLGIVLAALLIGLSPVVAAQHTNGFDNVRSLAKACQSVERDLEAAGRNKRQTVAPGTLLCLGFMQAMQDLSFLAVEDDRSVLGSCPPKNSTLLQLIQTLVIYAKTHGDENDESAALGVVKSFTVAHPCSLGDNSAGLHQFNDETDRREQLSFPRG